MPPPLLVTFSAAESAAPGASSWRIERVLAVIGETLPAAHHLTMMEGGKTGSQPVWSLRGTTSNLRYTRKTEAAALAAKQEGLGRPQAKCAALIPIKKNEAWWTLAQDERRAIMEERSRHIAIGMETLPQVSRRLHHCRDLGVGSDAPPFDFLTWFEFAPEHAGAFDDMVAKLRASEEWNYVEREVEVRVVR
jgi:chlorite dismutase